MYIKTSKSTSTFTILLTRTSLDLPYDKLFGRAYFYLWSPMKISLLYDHPWKSFLFMITHGKLSFLWLPVEIFPFYDHLWKSLFFMIIYENLSLLWPPMKIFPFSHHPWKSLFFMIIHENLSSLWSPMRISCLVLLFKQNIHEQQI